MADMKKEKLSNIQLGMLTLGFLYGSSAIVNPAMEAKRDAWIALILSWILGAGFILMTLYIATLNKDRSFNSIIENCFGKIMGRIIIIMYIIFFLFKAAINTRTFGMFMATVSYPETPLSVLMGVFIFAALYVVRCGFGTIAKISEILVPLIPIPVIFVAVSIITMKNYTGFQPILLEIFPVIKSAINVISTILGDYIVFLMIIPYTNSKKGRFKAVFMGYIGLGILLMIIVIRNLIVIGPVLMDNFMYPAHVAAQLIPSISIDPLVDVNLLLGGGFKVLIFIYAISKIIAELFKLDNYKIMACAISALIIILAYWLIPNSSDLKRWNNSWISIIVTIPFQLIFPVGMLLISMIKKPDLKKAENS